MKTVFRAMISIWAACLALSPLWADTAKVAVDHVVLNNNSAKVYITPVPGAVAYRVYGIDMPSVQKYTNGNHVEVNGVPAAGQFYVIEALNRDGKFQLQQPMSSDAMAGLVDWPINGHDMTGLTPNVLARSDPLFIKPIPFTPPAGTLLYEDWSKPRQIDFLGFNKALRDDGRYRYGVYGHPTDARPTTFMRRDWVTDDLDWMVQGYRLDALPLTSAAVLKPQWQPFIEHSHFMALVSNLEANSNLLLTNMRLPAITLDDTNELYISYEVDAHYTTRDWSGLLFFPYGEPLNDAETIASVDEVKPPGVAHNALNDSHRSIGVDVRTTVTVFQWCPGELNAERVGGPGYDRSAVNRGSLDDDRHRFECILRKNHIKFLEDGVVERDADLAMPIDYQVAFGWGHLIYHLANDTYELEKLLKSPDSTQIVPFDTKALDFEQALFNRARHWNNMLVVVRPRQ